MGFLSNRSSSSNVAGNVVLGGYADVFASGESFKSVGSVIRRSLYGTLSAAYPRSNTYAANLQSGALPASIDWKSIAFGNGILVAVGGNRIGPNGSGSTLTTIAAISKDGGKTWLQQTLPYAQCWMGVTYGNGLFVAVGSTNGVGTVYATSPDGVKWTMRNFTTGATWSAITFSAALGLFVAIAGGYNYTSNVVATSPDGVNWIYSTMPAAGGWVSIAANDAGVLVAIIAGAPGAGGAASTVCASSTNGTIWTARTIQNVAWTSVISGGDLFIAVGPTGASSSKDGTTWTAMAVPAGWTCNLIAYGNSTFFAMGTNSAATCVDGTTWVPRAVPTAAAMGCMTYNAGIFIAANGNYIDSVGGAGNNVVSIFSENSTDSEYMYISGTTGKFVRVK